MAEVYQKIESLSEGGDTEGLQNLMTELMEIAENAESCASELEEKYGEPEDEEKANAAFREACPDVAAIMEKAEEGQ